VLTALDAMCAAQCNSNWHSDNTLGWAYSFVHSLVCVGLGGMRAGSLGHRCQKRVALYEIVTVPYGHHLIFYSFPCTERTCSGYKTNINCSLTSLYQVKRFFFAAINTGE